MNPAKLTKADREVIARAIDYARRYWAQDQRNLQVKAKWRPGSTEYPPEWYAREAKKRERLIAKLDAAAAKLT